MEDITLAKNALFNNLKSYNEVIGASIRIFKGKKYIVVLLSRMTRAMKTKIPDHFMGAEVTHEVIGTVKAS